MRIPSRRAQIQSLTESAAAQIQRLVEVDTGEGDGEEGRRVNETDSVREEQGPSSTRKGARARGSSQL